MYTCISYYKLWILMDFGVQTTPDSKLGFQYSSSKTSCGANSMRTEGGRTEEATLARGTETRTAKSCEMGMSTWEDMGR